MSSTLHELMDGRAVEAEYGRELGEKRLRQLRWQKLGPRYIKARKRCLYRRADIEAWLDACTVNPETTTTTED